MGSFVVKRLAYSILVLLGTVTVVFLILRVVPGDVALTMLGPDAPQSDIDALREKLGLNRPIWQQYFSYMAGAFTLDFGTSARFGGSAMDAVLLRMPATASLATAAVLLAVVPGVLLGTVAALRPGKFIDKLVSIVSLALQSFPSFWIGLVLLLVFARWLGVLPSVGSGTPAHLILPAIALSLPFAAMVMRLTRSGLLEVLGEDYVRTARSKGLVERIVMFKHAFRNAMIPLITVIGIYVGGVLGGAVITETVFAWPGVGRLIVDAIGYRDYAVVQAGVIVFATIVVVTNLVVDVLYGYIDPKVRLGK